MYLKQIYICFCDLFFWWSIFKTQHSIPGANHDFFVAKFYSLKVWRRPSSCSQSMCNIFFTHKRQTGIVVLKPKALKVNHWFQWCLILFSLEIFLELCNVFWNCACQTKCTESSRQADNLRNAFSCEKCFERASDINDTMQAVQNMTMRAFIPHGKRRFAHILLCSLQNNKSETRLVRLSSSSHHTECEDQLRRKILEKIIRVDHAGEMGASFIYQGTTKI